jgi:hypothetical protein
MTDAEKATILSRLLASIEVMHSEAMSVGANMLAQQLEGARKRGPLGTRSALPVA